MATKERYVRASDLVRLAKWNPERTRGGLYVFYKVVRGGSRRPPYFTPVLKGSSVRDIRYLDSEVIIENNVDRRPGLGCAEGLNVLVHAPWRSGYIHDNSNALLLQVLVREDDIACVPSCSARAFDEYKLRVRRLLVVGLIKEEDLPREKLAGDWKWPLTWKGALGK